jgi:hypothetical protein
VVVGCGSVGGSGTIVEEEAATTATPSCSGINFVFEQFTPEHQHQTSITAAPSNQPRRLIAAIAIGSKLTKPTVTSSHKTTSAAAPINQCHHLTNGSVSINPTSDTTTDAPPDYDDTIKKRILITGCNSGIGFDAAQRMVVRGHEVVLACVSICHL